MHGLNIKAYINVVDKLKNTYVYMNLTGKNGVFQTNLIAIYALLGYYAVKSANSLLTFWNNPSVPSSSVQKSFLNRNVGKELSLFAA
jgi:hypothetical protein